MATDSAFPVKKLIAMPAELAERIAAFRFEQRIKTEAEAIRLLLERGLESQGAQQPPPPVRPARKPKA